MLYPEPTQVLPDFVKAWKGRLRQSSRSGVEKYFLEVEQEQGFEAWLELHALAMRVKELGEIAKKGYKLCGDGGDLLVLGPFEVSNNDGSKALRDADAGDEAADKFFEASDRRTGGCVVRTESEGKKECLGRSDVGTNTALVEVEEALSKLQEKAQEIKAKANTMDVEKDGRLRKKKQKSFTS